MVDRKWIKTANRVPTKHGLYLVNDGIGYAYWEGFWNAGKGDGINVVGTIITNWLED